MRTVLGVVSLVLLAWIAIAITFGFLAGRIMLKDHEGM